MHRVLIPSRAVRGGEALISDPDALHHLVDVLRVGVGDRVECFDGQGRSYAGRIVRIERSALALAVDERREEPMPRVAMRLAQALVRPDQFEWAIQKSTELGVAEILPMVTSRTRVRVPRHGGTERLARWRRIIEAAAAQCGRASLPVIAAPQAFEDVLKTAGARYVLLPTLAEAGHPLGDHAAAVQRAGEVMIMIGPEGDFSPEEVALAKARGAHPVTLGRARLKSETAAVVTLAVLQHLIGEL